LCGALPGGQLRYDDRPAGHADVSPALTFLDHSNGSSAELNSRPFMKMFIGREMLFLQVSLLFRFCCARKATFLGHFWLVAAERKQSSAEAAPYRKFKLLINFPK
jgi:hypothetical protein